MKFKFPNFRLFLVLAVLTGVVYPVVMTFLCGIIFPHQAHGSLIKSDNGVVMGSELIAQPMDGNRYFWPRPSAGDYATMPSGASNLAWSSAELKQTVEERRAHLLKAHQLPEGTPVPSDLLFASGSGLDPHISPAAAAFQLERVAQARGIPAETVKSLIGKHTRCGVILGDDVVNVLMLNIELDSMK